ncbi:MAG: AAA family ATPase [Pirellulales bacterium]|nr:AAA family ATPase [Pirellulales bacterium]
MRIHQLELRAFGPFTDVVLEFGDTPGRLHVVYGPNEAGKSSALRAVRQLLFGIDQRTDDSFLHNYSALRIGAVLESRDGQRLEVVRRKAQRDSLRGADDSAVVDPERLDRMLGGLSRDLYEQMFGLSHQVLVKGGRELAAGRGDLGQLLFSAGAGLSELRRLQQDLASEAATMYKPGNATIPLINQSLREWNEARRAFKDAQLPSTAWAKCEEACRHISERKHLVDGRLAACRRQRDKLASMERARPPIAARRRLRAELAALGPLPALGEEFATERRQVEADLAAARSVVVGAKHTLFELDRQLAACRVPASLLAAGEQIDELQRQLGSVLKADFDQVGLRSLIEQAEISAARLLRELRPDLALADVESLRLTRAERERIHALLVERAGLIARDEHARQQLIALRASLSTAEEAIAQQPPVVDTSSLRRAVSRAAKHGGLEEQAIEIAERIAALNRQVESELKKLVGWSSEWLAADSLVVPSLATVEDFEQRLRQADEQVARTTDSLHTARTTADALRLQIAEMRALNDPPSETSLAEARALRDQAWHALRRRLQGESTDTHQSQDGTESEVAHAVEEFELRQVRADDVADELRHDADRASQYARLQVQAREQDRLVAACQTDSETARVTRTRLLEEWQAIWSTAGVKPRTPAEMRGWLVQHERVVELARRLRDEQGRAELLAKRICLARDGLVELISTLGLATPECHLSELLEHAEDVCRHEDEQHTARALLESEVRRLRGEVANMEQTARDSSVRLAAWQRSWEQAISPLGLPKQATPEEATTVLAGIVDLFEQLDAAAGYRARLAAIDRDRAAFERNVHELASRLAPDLATKPATEVAGSVRDRLTAARQLHERHCALATEHLREEARLRDAQQAIIAFEAKLAELCRQADCLSADALPAVEQRVARGRELVGQLRTVGEQLLEVAAERSLEKFLSEVEAELEGTEDLGLRLIQVDDEIVELEQQRDTLARELGAAEAELRAMNGTPRAAEAAENSESVRAKLVTQVEHYARVRIAAALLHEAIELYREKNQGPVLRRASELFAQLTLGSFSGLRPEIDDDGQPILVGLRADRAAQVGVDGMSEGTRDQLYLALRLASLEQCLLGREPVPLLVDDILINFDNERTMATLKVLAQFAKRTQVILFTHQEHLLDLATAALEPGAWREHRLGPGAAAIGLRDAAATL